LDKGVGQLWGGAIPLLAPVGAVLAAAFLVNRYAKEKRKHVGRVVIILALFLVFSGLATLLRSSGLEVWAARARLVADLAQAFTIVNLVALTVFDLLLPRIGFPIAGISVDLLVGLAYIVSTIAVLRASGMELSSVVATSAVVSGVLALSLQATLGNILGGVALQLDGSIHTGDWVQLEGGKQGRVKAIRWRHTEVETRDWDTIIVPNATLLASSFTILGKREGKPLQHRMWVYFNVDFRHSPTRVIQVVEEALRQAPIPHVAQDPPPNVISMDFAKEGRDSFAYYACRYWLTDLAADDPTSSAIRGRIYTALRRANIPMARPASSVFMTMEDEESEKRRLERHRDRRLQAVRSVELFRPLTGAEQAFVSDHLVYAPFCSGETITRKGSVAHWLYILFGGKVDVRITVDGGVSSSVALLEAPAYFGEMALMTGEPRSADVVAVADAECYRLDKEGFEKILHDRPEIAQEISMTLAQRRVGLIAAREGLDAEARKRREESERAHILQRIEPCFGLVG
jgi:small-conductance mechanosensitive channel